MAHCREAYDNAEALKISAVARLEVDGVPEKPAKPTELSAALNSTYSALEYGFRS